MTDLLNEQRTKLHISDMCNLTRNFFIPCNERCDQVVGLLDNNRNRQGIMAQLIHLHCASSLGEEITGQVE
jgi:hypothetical protein